MLLNVTSTHQIPWIRVVDSPLHHYIQKRYGVISYDPDLDKFCLVRLKYSSSFRRFARGQFYLSEINDLASDLIKSESEYINSLLAMDIKHATSMYRDMLKDMYEDGQDHQIPGRIRRFETLHKTVRSIPISEKEEYLVFPSGMKEITEKDTSSAVRELVEETGISRIHSISENPIVYSYTSWDGIKYSIDYWIGIVEAPCESPRNKEVDGSIWVYDIPPEYDAKSIFDILKNVIKRSNITPNNTKLITYRRTMSTFTNNTINHVDNNMNAIPTSNEPSNKTVNKVSYAKFDPTAIRIGNSIPCEMTDKSTNQKIRFCKPGLFYTAEGKVMPLNMEAPRTTCGGLRAKEWKDSTGKVISSGEYENYEKAAQAHQANPGAPNQIRAYLNTLTPSHYKVTNRYSINNPAHFKYIEDQNKFSQIIINKIGTQHNVNFPMQIMGMGATGADPNSAYAQFIMGKFRHPVFQSKDDPSTYLEVCQFYSTGQSAPVFIGLNGETWPYAALMNKVITWVPLIHIKDVYENQSMVKPRKYLVGAIIIGATASGYADYQKDTLQAEAQDSENQAMYASAMAERMQGTSRNDIGSTAAAPTVPAGYNPYVNSQPTQVAAPMQQPLMAPQPMNTGSPNSPYNVTTNFNPTEYPVATIGQPPHMNTNPGMQQSVFPSQAFSQSPPMLSTQSAFPSSQTFPTQQNFQQPPPMMPGAGGFDVAAAIQQTQ